MPYIITSTHVSLFSISYIEASFVPRLINLKKDYSIRGLIGEALVEV
jgi:hypothetical protein